MLASKADPQRTSPAAVSLSKNSNLYVLDTFKAGINGGIRAIKRSSAVPSVEETSAVTNRRGGRQGHRRNLPPTNPKATFV
ncbi:uncharacterized protein ColSpa_04040 [Colletotrichum spaethianum]|uniref:Uncharacterized protein n=1 Tax=Colletotrichum spaethianum TaxID=700344 RepID=A0AA37LC58_9PEZI|nr:uncharacterized protein ColSpa_04040 [Colletotrichum spaethianum]GKT43859.1 hypothetical protein ColSpa_04040 [Colletotrichum spaethianum]